MQALHVTLNGTDVLNASTDECCSFSWDVACSRRDQEFGHLHIFGLVERGDGMRDVIEWIDDIVLHEGDDLTIQLLPGTGTSLVGKRKTYEEQEALRLEVLRAEAAGEYDEARATRPDMIRASCSIGLLAPGGITSEVQATGHIEATLCHGSWIDLRPNEWRIQLWSLPADKHESGFWCPIEKGIHIKIRS